MIERLRAFYRRSLGGLGDCASPIWQGLMGRFWNDSQKIMANGTDDQIRELLDDFVNRGGGAYGIENVKPFVWGTDNSNAFLARLANHTGVMPLDNPENPGHVNFGPRDWKSLKAMVEKEMGFELALPDHLGMNLKDGVPSRLFHYTAAAYSIRNWFGGIPIRTLEIGPGFGNLGVILFRWHAPSYTVIDLPLQGTLCAYALSKTCGPDNIWLWGEENRNDGFAKIYPAVAHKEVSDSYDLVFNSDSFPEIPPKMQQQYLDLACKHGRFLFSINHESDKDGQISMAAAVKAHGRLNRRSRHLFTIRQGYVEEVYAP